MWRSVVVLFLVGVALAASSTPAVAQTTCSDAKIKGDYGFAGTALVPNPQSGGTVVFDPMSEIAAISYDGKGAVTMKTKVQYHGSVSAVATVGGTYKVENDCTGTADFTNSTGAVVYKWVFVVVHGGDELETVALIAAKPGRPMYSMSFTQKKL